MNRTQEQHKIQNEMLEFSIDVYNNRKILTKNTLHRKIPGLSIRRINSICKKYNIKMLTEIEYKILVGNKYSTQKYSFDEFVDKATKVHDNFFSYINYNGSHKEVKIICPVHGLFTQMAYSHIAGKVGCEKCVNIKVSKAENEIKEIFEKEGIPTKKDRAVLQGKEIDIYSDEFKFGVEYNGLMWHSIGNSKYSKFNKPYTTTAKNQHRFKTDLSNLKQIQLFHIFENEWLNPVKREIWTSIISDKLQKNKKIGARKTEVRIVPHSKSKEFENSNHLQGFAVSKIRLGLFYKNELVSLMTFGKGRSTISSGFEWELIRFCSKKGYTIQGGASKLFSYFIKTYTPKSIKTFANRRWSQGNLYQKLGFIESHISEPNYFYFLETDKTKTLYSRNKFQKHKLKELIKNFDPLKTAWENMRDNGYRKIYDSGNIVFTWRSAPAPQRSVTLKEL